jgi:scyllo-inositol 2-dehydrogenase (NADP+)
MDKIQVGLVGYGVSGRVFHGPLLRSNLNFELTHVVSSQKAKVHQDFPEARVMEEFDILLKSDVDLIVITTPNTLHFSQTKAALNANKNVILEKPFTPTSKEGEELIELSSKKNLMLTVFQNRRWDGDFLTVQRLLSEKKMGKIITFESHFDRFRPMINKDRWRERETPGSGILYDLGSHLIDQALVLFGKPLALQADVAALREGALVDDYFHLVFFYEGFRVILHSSTVVKDVGPRFAIHGTEGSFVKFGLDPQEDELRAGKIPINEKNWGSENEKAYGTLTLDNEKMKIQTIPGNYPKFYDGVFECLKKNGPPPVKVAEAIQNIILIEACILSSTSGKRINLDK